MADIEEKKKQRLQFLRVTSLLRKKEIKTSYSNRKTLADFVKLADDEVIIKDYHSTVVKKPSYGEGHFAVTNKRLIMYLWSEETIRVNGVNVKDVVGTAVYYSKDSFAVVINIRAATGALSFYSYPRNILEKRLEPERLEMKTAPGPDMVNMSKELGALILNMRKVER